jgi:CheY-like chemotaxis protein
MMGDVVLAKLKADPETNSIPVVIVSADATKRQISAFLSAGAVGYVTKPIELVRLFEILNEQLSEVVQPRPDA